MEMEAGMPKIVDHDERRDTVVSLTARVIARDGISGVSFKGIADEAGASTAIVSHYFANKQELLRHTYRTLLGRSQQEQAKLIQKRGSTVLDLAEVLLPLREEMISAWRISIEFFSEAMTDPAIKAEWEKNLTGAAAGFQILFDRMIERGEIPATVSSYEASMEMLALIRGIGTEVALCGSRWTGEAQRRAVRRMLTALKTDSPE